MLRRLSYAGGDLTPAVNSSLSLARSVRGHQKIKGKVMGPRLPAFRYH